MATADTSGGDNGAEASACARDFVVDRLREADSPMAPAELANEYGCTNGHVRNLLADLMDEGEAERVGRGQYVAAESEPVEGETDLVADLQADSEGSTEATAGDADTESSADPSADGGPHSEDLATEVEEDRDDDLPGTGEAAGAAVVGAGGALPMMLTNDGETDWAVVALVVVVVLAAAWYWLRKKDSDEQSDEEQEQQQNGQQGGSGGGLVSGETWG